MLSEFPKIKLFAVIAERSKPAWRSSSTRVLTMPRDAAVTAEMGGPFCSTTKLATKLIFLLVQEKNNKVEGGTAITDCAGTATAAMPP